jgi:dihydroneopterin aldolase
MANSRILLTGIEASGRHGANPGEQLETQPFVVDLDVSVEVHGDDLDATTDYRVLADAARETVEGGSFQLLESLAEAVARAVYQYEGVMRVTALVHKPNAARSMGAGDVAVEATIV